MPLNLFLLRDFLWAECMFPFAGDWRTFVALREAVLGLLNAVLEILLVRPHPGTLLEVLECRLVITLLQQKFRLVQQSLKQMYTVKPGLAVTFIKQPTCLKQPYR